MRARVCHHLVRMVFTRWTIAFALCVAGVAFAGEDALRAEFRRALPRQAHANGRVVDFELVAAPTELPLVDGHEIRVWAYNGQVPGPTFRVRLGDTVRVRFINRLPQETTVHWHGVRVPNGMDGVPNLTQPPVPPGGTFTYEFTPKDVVRNRAQRRRLAAASLRDGNRDCLLVDIKTDES
jgi:FtsP/CotA-like multicopper oxidase with cupredoxin domain